MPFWTDQVVPRMTDKMLGTRDVMNHRHVAVDGLRGDVVEIGFGSGLNVPLYPPEVTTVYAVDPSLVGRKLSADRVAVSPVRIEFVGLDGEALPLDDASVDTALSTFTLCTIPDAARAVREVAPGAAAGGHVPLPRARPVPRRRRRALAAPTERCAATRRRRVHP